MIDGQQAFHGALLLVHSFKSQCLAVFGVLVSGAGDPGNAVRNRRKRLIRGGSRSINRRCYVACYLLVGQIFIESLQLVEIGLSAG